ncbi:PoNe immunity protein domain-containing protein [Janthinobacterium sp. P210005]|uniref:PoNe immunity protein domain-containing protein n=1 Tax=Janthinobacterium sp. P210005 TaxID=3112938 RepID=UPI002E254D6B|nr:PoNe immunity protein domain-containing protein [Janthinobacterium sp. P210005]
MQTLDEHTFLARRREPLLSYAIYLESKDSLDECFDMVEAGLQQPAEVLQNIPPENFMTATRQRAWDGIDLLSLAYSAGHTIADLRALYPTILEYWEEFANYDRAFDVQACAAEQGFPHFALPGDGYEQVNRMICLGILLGWGNLLPRLAPVIDFNNHEKDGLVERLLAFSIDNRDTTWPECTRHLPYVKTLKIFAAEKNQRPALMKDYLRQWYDASRREPYYDSHARDTSFSGYWSWEAAAITCLLDIDDSSYRDAKFYPADLVAFHRQPPSMRSEPA